MIGFDPKGPNKSTRLSESLYANLCGVNSTFNSLHIINRIFTIATSASSLHGQKKLKYYIPTIDSREIPTRQTTVATSNSVHENTQLRKKFVPFQFRCYELSFATDIYIFT